MRKCLKLGVPTIQILVAILGRSRFETSFGYGLVVPL